MEEKLPFYQWNDLPWNFFNDLYYQWEVLPTFLGIEYMTYFLSIISLIHAIKNSKNHLLVWLASIITGTSNDIFFMALPMVNNFWQAQATIMLSPRLPLYICCIYNIFLYYSTISSWRLTFENMWPEAAITGILALLIYYPYDLIGVKHLWWTWHTTDPAVMNRIAGVPIGSSVWILTFAACFSFILYIFRGKLKMNFFSTLFFSALLTTPLMLVIMTVLQYVALEKQGVPSISSLNLCLFLYVAVIIIYSTLLIDTSQSFKWIEHRCLTKFDIVLGVSIIIYYIFLVLAGNFGNPVNFKSTGVHQPFGPCNETVTDVMGLTRDKYVCLKNMPSEWDFSCVPKKENLVENENITYWYTICGTPNSQESVWKWYLNSICTVSALAYFAILILSYVRARLRTILKKNQ